jgi:hypothetical protein
MLVHSVFLNALLFPFIMEPLWILWALTFVAQQREASPARASRSLVVASLAIAPR